MKKIALFALCFTFSGLVSAAAAVIPEDGKVTQVACTALNEDIKIGLSTNVKGGFECSATAVKLAACHTNGRVSSRTAFKETCTGEGEEEVCVTSTTVTETVTGPAVYTASSAGGQVTAQYPGGGTCQDSTVTTAASL